MFNVVNKSIEWNGKKIELETGKIARQADASVVVKMGESIILCTVTYSKEVKEGIDFFPLTVHYLERYYAAGKFPGGFMKREAKPSDRETLIARLIDRPIRPLFPEDFFHEVNVMCQVLSYDAETPVDVLAIIGTAAALRISEVPFPNTLAAIKIGMKNGEFIINPTPLELETSDLDLTIAGTKDSVLMIESSAKEIGEEQLIAAIEFGHNNIKPIIELIEEFTAVAGKNKCDYVKFGISEMYQNLKQELHGEIQNVYKIVDKKERNTNLKGFYNSALAKHSTVDGFKKNVFDIAFKKLQKEVVRSNILDNKTRIDGRKLDDIRNIECEVGFLPKTHGSALFTRGETQSLAIVTLGSMQDSQLRDDITGVSSDRFLLHYNFPPYSVGEVGMLRPPGRREIGHGKLAHKAILPILPDNDTFPYTIRIVSEITESNGSSSMATVCASILSLMDTGVPIKTPVAGIAMGLILEQDRFAILSDILGDEDALGDMDFKVASTKDGITALQMDIKIDGITIEIMKQAVSQAKKGCHHILEKMIAVIAEPKGDLSSSAPRIVSISINKEKIGAIIGPGGKIIKDICEKSGAKIDIDDDGKVSVFAKDEESLMIAKKMITDIVAEPEQGTIYTAKVMKIMPFGVFAKFLGNLEGLVHISEIADKKINDVESILSEGEFVNVQYSGVDNRGKFKLTMKGIKQSDEFYGKASWKQLMDGTEKQPTEEKEAKKERYAPAKRENRHHDRNNDRHSDHNNERHTEKKEVAKEGHKVGQNDEDPKDENSSFQKAKSFINKVLSDF